MLVTVTAVVCLLCLSIGAVSFVRFVRNAFTEADQSGPLDHYAGDV